MEIPAEGLKLNIGAGRTTPDDWFNIDIEQNPDASRKLDLLSDAKKIDLPDGCASHVMAIHLLEHLYRWECDGAIEEWKRLLRPGGRLILELPDMIKFCQNIVSGLKRAGKHPDQLGMWGAWGDPRTKNPYMAHRWGWSPQSLTSLLQEHGFIKIRHLPTEFHGTGRKHRDMRIEAVKPC